MRIDGTGFDRTDDCILGEIDKCDHATVLASDVEQAAWPDLEAVRRHVWRKIDVGHMPARLKVDDGQQMAGVGIAPMDAISVDRDVSGGRLRRDQELMR